MTVLSILDDFPTTTVYESSSDEGEKSEKRRKSWRTRLLHRHVPKSTDQSLQALTRRLALF